MRIGIVGGGIMGISLAYFLSRRGVSVEIYEASPTIGGLAGPYHLADGTTIDRFYHTILSSDRHLIELCSELGISDRLRFNETKMGFYYNRQVYSMNNIVQFLRFPPLGWVDRFRLGLTVLYAQLIKDWNHLEGIDVESWLVRLSGKGTFENIWRPMLKAKFDGSFENTPATYIWSRLVRMKSTRNGASQKEEAGHLIGGYLTLLEAMMAKVQAQDGHIFYQTPVKEIVIENEQVIGLRVGDEIRSYDAVIATLQTPIFARLIPAASPEYRDFLAKTDYLGVIAALMVMDRPLTGYWTINITDDSIPFTGIIETTTYIDSRYVGGHHLVYLPKYTAPGSEWQKKSDEEITAIWLENLQKMFPDFSQESIRYFVVNREKYVEPIHGLNQTDLIPSIQTPISNLYLATTAQIYPALTNGESVSHMAKEAAELVLEETIARPEKIS